MTDTNTPFSTLPQDIKNVLVSDITVERVEKIALKQGLNDFLTGMLIRITGKLLEGTIPPEHYVTSLCEELEIPREKAAFIAQEINRDIFNSIKESLKKIHNAKAKMVTVGLSEYARTHPTPSGFVFSPPTAKETPVVTPEIKPPSALSAAKVAPVPKSAVTPPVGNKPIRSEWGWHGVKNEITGKIEFRRETTRPELLNKEPTTPQGGPAGAPHIGSIFEQKLGNTFLMKGETAQYEGTSLPEATPRASVPATSTAPAVAQSSPRETTTPTASAPQRSEMVVPIKENQVAKKNVPTKPPVTVPVRPSGNNAKMSVPTKPVLPQKPKS